MASQDSNTSLEDKLRSMILSNVRIGESQQAPGADNPGGAIHHGSKRGRGSDAPQKGYGDRARGRGQFSGPMRGQYRQDASVSASSGDYGGSRGSNHPRASVTTGRGRGHRGGFDHSSERGRGHSRMNGYQSFHHARNPPPPGAQLWSPGSHQQQVSIQTHGQRRFDAGVKYLEDLASLEIPKVEMTTAELGLKDAFRTELNTIFAAAQNESTPTADAGIRMALHSFGSLKSGFATAGSDMDLVIVDVHESAESPQISLQEDGLPRRFEKELLANGYGARLLTRARVPIIKVCEKPTPELLQALREARTQWESLPEDEKYDRVKEKKPEVDVEKQQSQEASGPASTLAEASQESQRPEIGNSNTPVGGEAAQGPSKDSPGNIKSASQEHDESQAGQLADTIKSGNTSTVQGKPPSKPSKPWLREKKKGPLDFPKDGVGIQCDINFFNPLGLYNTHMLYCYSLCDPRVRLMILFVKAWARKRKINNSYSGTLSSYGYVLMVLHYLVNVARPPVVPNLQLEALKANLAGRTIDGWQVTFWGDENEIKQAATSGNLSRNKESLGSLLKGFFQYYASTSGNYGFVWMRDVLSLRTPGGIMSKEEKGWTGAKTEMTDTKEIRHRYLFALEDPFEVTHNVARTVTHPGIVAIRDEFRRAWRILTALWQGREIQEGLLDELVEQDTKNDAVNEGHAESKASVPEHTAAAPTDHAEITIEDGAEHPKLEASQD